MKRRDSSGSEPALKIQVMSASDLDGVLAIERVAFPSPWSRENFLHELANPCSRNWVARHDQEVAASVCVWIVAGELKINNIAVHPRWRGRGLGAALLERVMDEARLAGCEEATLEVRPSNRSALALYRRYGFRPIGRRRGYYQDTGEDAIVMAVGLKDLGGDPGAGDSVQG